MLITGEELLAKDDLGPCELVRGKIVHAKPTSPEHGSIEGRFYYVLESFVGPRKLGRFGVGIKVANSWFFHRL